MTVERATVRVWAGRTRASDDPVLAWTAADLGAEDARRLPAFLVEADRRRFLTGRAMIVALMAERGLGPSEYRIVRPTVAGGESKPLLVASDGRRLPHISLAHSGELVLLASSDDAEVGVDVEAVAALESLPDSAVEVFLAAGELRELATVPGAERASVLTTTFTRKEAALKAIGFGLAVDPRSLRLSGPGQRPEVLSFTAPEARELVICDVDLGAIDESSGYRAALAVCTGNASGSEPEVEACR